MKVTVCFGTIRIVVPCGSGDLLVKDLINEATRRYKKAAGKEPGSWVAVHHLQTQSGILDPDDCVRDVADDREQILASFEDSCPDPGVPQGGGDGASGSSSVGTGSPDIFRDPTNTDAPTNGTHGDVSTPHIEVTSTTACSIPGLGLQVRRSSDPNLMASLKAESGNKRWSAAAPHCAGDSPERVRMEKSGYLTPQWEEDDDAQHQASAAPTQQPFARSGRLSMQFLGDGTGYKWIEAAEKLQHQQQHQMHYQQHQHQQQHQQQQQPQHQQHHQYQQQAQIYTTKSLPRESKRKEPLGQAYESIREKDGEMLLIINEYGSPLGLTAIPDNEHGGGLLVQHVEPGSRAERGRLRRGDRILEINGTKLIGLTESKVQDHLRRSLEASELRIRVIRANQKSGVGGAAGGGGGGGGGKSRRRDSKVAEMIEAEERTTSTLESKVATVSPTRKPHTAPVGTSLQVANTRKLGRKIEIILMKGPNGLGFSVTTRDNPAGGHCPIYIKNILPRGAAIEDGRLKPGDRLLEVDGVPMTGKTQTDVVSVLRATQTGATVRIVVSRQQEVDEREVNYDEKENELNSPPKPPAPVLPSSKHKKHQQRQQDITLPNGVQKSNSARSLFEQHHLQQQQNLNESQHFIDAGSESAASSDSLQAGIAWRSREVLTLHIPVHDTEKAGLGVSVKGKTSSNTTSSSNGSNGSMKHDGDLGIFVKNVIHGGAASRDGRLRMNDQLLSVNGVSLLGQNNAEAMETLRRAMVNNPGKHPGMITLSVARKIARSASSGDILEHTTTSTNDSSNTSENSGATVIYLSPDKKDAGRNSSEMNRWSNPVLDRLTGGVCSSSSNSSQQGRRPSRDHLATAGVGGGGGGAGVGSIHSSGVPHTLRNESYYMATNDTWSPALHQQQHIHNGHVNNNVLIEDDPEPLSPLPHRPNESACTQSSTSTKSTAPANFDATYSSQLSLETNNSGVEHFSRDALGRRSISEKHHAALDARETGTYQRNKKIREERERERRIKLTKSAIYSGSVESLTTRIANANAQIPGYKHSKTASGIDPHTQLQGEALDQVSDLGPSLGLKKSSSLESLQTMVQEIQMSDEPRGPSALRAPRGRGREDSLRAAVVGDHEVGKPRKHWLLEDGTDADGGFANRNGPFQSSLNDGKHKSRAKKPSILRGIGHMFRFGKNRKDCVVPVETHPPRPPSSERPPANLPGVSNNQVPVAALAALDRNNKHQMVPPPAYQPPPPLPPANSSGSGGGGGSMTTSSNSGIHQNDIFNHRYQHYANYDELLHTHQIRNSSDDNSSSSIGSSSTATTATITTTTNDVLSESTLECMRQQVIRQRIKVEAESRRHQHYHSQRSARSQDISLHPHSLHHHHHQLQQQQQQQQQHAGLLNNLNNLNGSINGNDSITSGGCGSGGLRPTSSYYEYETVQHGAVTAAAAAAAAAAVSVTQQKQQLHHQQRAGSLKQNGGHTPILLNGHQQQRQSPTPMQPHWKVATMNGFSPASLNSSARSRGPFVTQVTIREQSNSPAAAQQQQQPTYQTVQKQHHQAASARASPQQQQQQPQAQASKV